MSKVKVSESIRTLGRLLVIACVVRSLMLARLLWMLRSEHAEFYMDGTSCDGDISAVILGNACWFSRIAGEIIQGRVLAHYSDLFDSLPTAIGVSLGLFLCWASKRMTPSDTSPTAD